MFNLDGYLFLIRNGINGGRKMDTGKRTDGKDSDGMRMRMSNDDETGTRIDATDWHLKYQAPLWPS